MARYSIRYFFDPGSGVCLWAANDAARERWGYALDANALSLPEKLSTSVERMIAWYDQSIDWRYPPGPSPWSAAERVKFNRAAQFLLQELQAFLGREFEVIDESGTLDAA